MREFGTRYLLLCVALIAACLAFTQIPVPPPTVFDINGDIESAPNALHSMLYHLRGFAYVGAISIFMHAICTVLRLKMVSRWIISILIPTIVTFTCHLWWVDYVRRTGIHYPITISPLTVFIINAISFTMSTVVVTVLLAFLIPLVKRKKTTTTENSQITI